MNTKKTIIISVFLLATGTLGVFAFENIDKMRSNSKDFPPRTEPERKLAENVQVVKISDPLLNIDGDPSKYTKLEFPNNTLDTSDWETYRNEEFGFEIKYPKNVVTVSDKQVSEMKEMYEFGFYIPWHLGRVDIKMPSANIGMNIYVYDKSVDTMFKMYCDQHKSSTDTLGSIPVNNMNLLFLVADKTYEDGDLFRYQRAYFAGDAKHAYEITPTQIPEEYKKIFQKILSSFTLIK